MSKPCIFRFNGHSRSVFQFVNLLALAAIVSFFSVTASAQTTFTNDTLILLNDSTTFPEPVASDPYPSNIVVTGMTGNITDVNLRFNGMNHTFPGDLNILLVGPGGQKLIFQSFCGYDTMANSLTYSIDDQAATQLPTAQGVPILAQPYRPTTFLFPGYPQTLPYFLAPAPADCLNPRQASCTLAPNRGAGTMASVFNGISPNGTWSLYIVDQGPGDSGDLSGGWSLIITTDGPTITGDAPVDLNGDGRTDYAVVRETGAATQSTWFYNLNNSANPTVAFAWGVGIDFPISEDFDNDNKDDIAVWRPTNGTFYIFNSLTSTVRVEQFGQNGDNPSVVDDYNNDGSADLAVYRAGAQSTWFYRTTPNGPVFYVPWGTTGDFVAPGDYNGDGNADFGVQRDAGVNADFWIRLSTGAVSVTRFGLPSDFVVPGDYDADGKIDIAVSRNVGGAIHWFWIRSFNSAVVGPVVFGASATDYRAQGDYDGDGDVEPAVWRDSTGQFISLTSTGGGSFFQLGSTGDFPVASFNVH